MKDDTRHELMRVRATLRGPDGIERDVDEDVGTIALVTNDFDAIQRAVLGHGGKFAYWSMLETLAAEEEQSARDALDALEADKLSQSSDDSTVTKAKAVMRTDPQWKQLHDAWRAAQRTSALVKVGRKTVEQHKEGLQEACRNFRAEMEFLLEVRGRTGVVPSAAERAEQAERSMRDFVAKKRER